MKLSPSLTNPRHGMGQDCTACKSGQGMKHYRDSSELGHASPLTSSLLLADVSRSGSRYTSTRSLTTAGSINNSHGHGTGISQDTKSTRAADLDGKRCSKPSWSLTPGYGLGRNLEYYPRSSTTVASGLSRTTRRAVSRGFHVVVAPAISTHLNNITAHGFASFGSIFRGVVSTVGNRASSCLLSGHPPTRESRVDSAWGISICLGSRGRLQ